MSLIHDQERDASSVVQHLEELRILHPLGRRVDELRDAVVNLLIGSSRFACAQCGVDLLDGDVGLGSPLLLILHQSDKGTDDDDRLWKEQRWQLVGQALAGAGRHQTEDTATAEYLVQDVLLPGPEALDPKPSLRLAQDLGPGNRFDLGLAACPPRLRRVFPLRVRGGHRGSRRSRPAGTRSFFRTSLNSCYR